jgi:predicted nucleotidyltransferase
MDNVKEVIAKFESESESKVIFAVEAGSKAWGFPSRDSDHDLRLVYFRPEYKKRRLGLPKRHRRKV